MKLFSSEKPSASDMRDDARCAKCGGQPQLICKMLEPRSGKTLCMFDCKCGDRTWRE